MTIFTPGSALDPGLIMKQVDAEFVRLQGNIGTGGGSGTQGPPGPQGPQGVPGPAGADGAAGPKGDTGAAGPQGVPGAAGATGATGLTGPQGAKGDPGAIGATGAQGPQGATGPQGVPGAGGGVPSSGRLVFVDATHVAFMPYNGDTIKIAGQIYQIPPGGITATNAALAANTLYYVYLWNNAGTLTIQFSGGTHATDTTAGNVGVEILSGNNSRTLIGMVATDANGQFADGGVNAGVASWFNRRRKTLAIGYGNCSTTSANATWVNLSGASGIFVCWGDDAVDLVTSGQTCCAAGGAGTLSAVGYWLDGGVGGDTLATMYAFSAPNGGPGYGTGGTAMVQATNAWKGTIAEGRHTIGIQGFGSANTSPATGYCQNAMTYGSIMQ